MLDMKKYGIADEWPKLQAMQEEVASLERQRAQAEQEGVAARNAIPVAQEQDTVAAAKAVRGGKSVPAAKHEAKAIAALEDAERTLSAYQKAAADAQADMGTFIAQNRAALRAAIAGALDQNARELAHHARKAAELYGFLEDAKYDVKRLAPPPPPPDENAPAQRLSTTVIGVTTHRAAGPNRGDVEQMLAYLASLGPEEQESAA